MSRGGAGRPSCCHPAGALRAVIGQLEQHILGDQVLGRQVPLADVSVAEVSLDAIPRVEDLLAQVGQRIVCGEYGERGSGIRRPHGAVEGLSERVLKTLSPIADHDLGGVVDAVAAAQRQAIAAADAIGESDPGSEVVVVPIGQAAGDAVAAGEQLPPGRQIEAGNAVMAVDGPAEILPPNPQVERQVRRGAPVILEIQPQVLVEEALREGLPGRSGSG